MDSDNSVKNSAQHPTKTLKVIRDGIVVSVHIVYDLDALVRAHCPDIPSRVQKAGEVTPFKKK